MGQTLYARSSHISRLPGAGKGHADLADGGLDIVVLLLRIYLVVLTLCKGLRLVRDDILFV